MYSKIIRNIRQVNSLKNVYFKVPYRSYSNPKERKSVDPFGLAEEFQNDESGIEKMIQGIYTTPPRPRQNTQITNHDSDSHSGSGTVSTDEAKFANFNNPVEDLNQQQDKMSQHNPVDPFEVFEKKHGHWLKSKADRIFERDITAEKIHSPHFGEVRLDSENLTIIDGQFDENFFDPEEGRYISEKKFKHLSKKSFGIRNPTNIDQVNQNKEVVEEEILTRISKGNFDAAINIKEKQQIHSDGGVSNRNMTSKNQKVEPQGLDPAVADTGSSQASVSKDKAKAKLDLKHDSELAAPKTALQYLKLKKLTEAQKDTKLVIKLGGRETHIDKSSVQTMPVQHIPTIYQHADFNDVPHDDVWYYLRKHICFHNNFLIALNKPYGFPMHTPSVDCRHTIIDFLPELAAYAKVKEIFPCHRLDKDTTGVLLLAKSEQAAIAIKQKFANRSIKKMYFAITKNCPEIPEGTIKIPIGEGQIPKSGVFRAVLKPDLEKFNITTMQKACKEAVTKFRVIRSQPYGAFLEVFPETGLTHQIRVHLAQGLGCPILGDHKYSHRDKMAPQRLHTEVLDRLKVKQSKVRHLPLHLHSSKVEFTMPDGFMNQQWREPIFIHARPPKYFLHTMRTLGLKT